MDRTIEKLIFNITNKGYILFFFGETVMVGKDLGDGEIDKDDIIELKVRPHYNIKETLDDLIYIIETKDENKSKN